MAIFVLGRWESLNEIIVRLSAWNGGNPYFGETDNNMASYYRTTGHFCHQTSLEAPRQGLSKSDVKPRSPLLINEYFSLGPFWHVFWLVAKFPEALPVSTSPKAWLKSANLEPYGTRDFFQSGHLRSTRRSWFKILDLNTWQLWPCVDPFGNICTRLQCTWSISVCIGE